MNLLYFKKCFLLLFVAGGLIAVTDVKAITITPATLAAATGNQTSQSEIDAVLDGLIGTSTALYKKDVNPPQEEGSLAGSYQTTFSNSSSDPADALIHYVGGTAVGPNAYLLVKDGNSSPAWYLFNLSSLGWNGTDDVVLQGFWPNEGAISHVSLYQSSRSVPEGGATLALLGLSLGVVGLLRWKIKSA